MADPPHPIRQEHLAILTYGPGKVDDLPAAGLSNGPVVVVSPLKSLMKDQVDKFNNPPLQGKMRAERIDSTPESRERLTKVQEACVKGEVHLLFVSPNGLRSTRSSNIGQAAAHVRRC
jgi:superfamily II DNA helicase RecQ